MQKVDRFNKRQKTLLIYCSFLLFLTRGADTLAQGQISAPPQEAPADQPKSKEPEPQKNDRIFGVIPNYRTIEKPKPGERPLTTKEKIKLAFDDSFDPYAYPIAGAFALYGQAQNDPKSWGQGFGAFAKRYAASFADQTDENFMVEAFVPALFKQDPRYFRSGNGGILRRTGYAVSRIWVTRADSGHSTFNFSEILGAGLSSGVSNAYYPSEDRTTSKNLSRWAILVGEDTFFNVLKEFWPDIRQRLLRK